MVILRLRTAHHVTLNCSCWASAGQRVSLLGTSQKRYVHGTNVDCVHFCFVLFNQKEKRKTFGVQEHSADSTLIRRKVEK